VGAQYEFAFANGASITPRVDASYQGSMYTNGNNRPATADPMSNFIESYTVANARVTYRDAEDKWEASLELTNFTDEYYFLTRTDQFAGAGHTDGQPGRPREWGLTVKRKF
jgi:iron complex outermembrane receptor protein